MLNKKGMTLIEMMIALVLLMLVSLAVMKTALLGINENMKNALRNEAVNVADQKMNELRNTDFAVISLGTQTETGIDRTFRASSVTFTPARTVTQVNADAIQINVAVSWTYRGKDYTHSVTTIRGRQ